MLSLASAHAPMLRKSVKLISESFSALMFPSLCLNRWCISSIMAKDGECCFKSAEEMVMVCIVCVCDGRMLPLNSSFKFFLSLQPFTAGQKL